MCILDVVINNLNQIFFCHPLHQLTYHIKMKTHLSSYSRNRIVTIIYLYVHKPMTKKKCPFILKLLKLQMFTIFLFKCLLFFYF